MSTLTTAIAIGGKQALLDTALGVTPPFAVKIDSELLQVGGIDYRAGTTLAFKYPATAAHAANATVTPVLDAFTEDNSSPFASGGGSGIPQGGPLTEPLDADGNPIVNLADPTDPQDAATMAYVDEATDGMAGPLLSFTRDLDAFEIATLSSVPVQVVAAPGANKVIVPLLIALQFQAGATPYETAIPEIRLGTQGIGVMFSDAGLDGADDTVSSLSSVGLGHVQADVANQPLRLSADLDPDTDGDGTARLTVLYYVMDLLV